MQSQAAYNAYRRFNPKLLELEAATLVDRLTLLPMPISALRVADLFDIMRDKAFKHLILLDQCVVDIEAEGKKVSYGYEVQKDDLKLTIIDHHVSDPYFSKRSTGNLAIRYILDTSEGPPKDAKIGITHGDCDSVIASLIMLGVLQPDSIYGDAVLAADHSFIENPIADLLQAIEAVPNAGDTVIGKISTNLQNESFSTSDFTTRLSDLRPSLEFSIRNLGLLLQDKKLDAEVETSLIARVSARKAWPERIKKDQIIEFPNGTFLSQISESLSHDPCPEFLQKLLPQAKLILVFHPSPDQPKFIQVRGLRGLAAGTTFEISDPRLINDSLIPGFRGRSAAGSTRRSGISFKGNALDVSKKIDLNLAQLLR